MAAGLPVPLPLPAPLPLPVPLGYGDSLGYADPAAYAVPQAYPQPECYPQPVLLPAPVPVGNVLPLPAPEPIPANEAVSAEPSIPAEQAPAEDAADPDDEEIEYTVSPMGRLSEVLNHREFQSFKVAFVSAVLHALALFVMSEVAVRNQDVAQGPTEIYSYLMAEEEEPLVLPEPELELAPPSDTPHDEVMAAMATSIGRIENAEAFIKDEPNPPNVEVAVDLREIPPMEPLEGFVSDDVFLHHGTVGESPVHVEGAVDRITYEIAMRLEKGPVMAIWLMDASVSLVEERQKVADRLEGIYRELGQLGEDGSGGLMNAVVSFGQGANELCPPSLEGIKAVEAMRTIPSDESGIENVFSTVSWAVDRYKVYRTQERRQTMVIIWTDESGDDYAQLENAVALCRRYTIPVFTVGPSAMFGRQLGYRTYNHPEDGKDYQIPIFRGPDTAFQERISLPYWFNGPQLDTLHSGMGPYALTRLSIETGGMYFINDQQTDRSKFTLDTMLPYLPEYYSAMEVARQNQASPLRRAVLAAVEMTQQMKFKGTPQLEFAPTGKTYQTELKDAQMTAAYNIRNLELVLQLFDRKLEDEYEKEESPRWRAWYDLTKGRLLGMLVRNYEYNWVCAELKGKGAEFVDQKSNRWKFRPSPETRMSSTTANQAREADRLLKRCVSNNPNTPWEQLAQRELKDAFGFSVDESYVAPPPPPTPPKANPNPVPPPPPVPNMVRRTEELRRLERPKQVTLPKL